MKKIIGLIMILFLIAITAGFFWFQKSISSEIKTASTEEVVQIDPKKVEVLEKLIHPGQPVTLDEPGYGRENPFVSY